MVTGHWPLVGQGHCQLHQVVYASQTHWSNHGLLVRSSWVRSQNTEYFASNDARTLSFTNTQKELSSVTYFPNGALVTLQGVLRLKISAESSESEPADQVKRPKLTKLTKWSGHFSSMNNVTSLYSCRVFANQLLYGCLWLLGYYTHPISSV